jgi:N-acetylmuramoyl-L-alanine amidase
MRRVHVIRIGWIAALIGVGGLAAVGAAASAHGAASQGDLLKVRFGGDQNQTRIVVEMSRSAQAKLISGGQPLVLELPRIDLGAERQGRGQGLVRAWSADTTAGAARIKLDMARPAEIERRFLLSPSDGITSYRYVIDLKAKARGAVTPSVKNTPAALAPTTTLTSTAPTPKAPAAPPTPSKRVIVIDAGHGGRDPGALGDNVQEKAITLSAARALKARLERDGRYRVVLTRETDTFVPLENRMQIARRAGADLFISLHADAGADADLKGASIYTLSDKGSDRVQHSVAANNGLFNISLPGADKAVKQILLDLTQRATRNRSAAFAETLLEEIDGEIPLLGRSHRDENFFVLLAPDVPAVLLEMGFVTNPDDEKRLTDPRRRAALADATANAIDKFFSQDLSLASR